MLFDKKTVLITGGSRGIGKMIAIKLAAGGANVAIAAKTVDPHPKLEGTIYSAADEIDKSGPGRVLPIAADIRHEESITEMVHKTVEAFGGIDILINNASAINLSPTEHLESKRYDLMQDINVRGTFLVSRACIPHLRQSPSAHILNLSPPLDMNPKWFRSHLAYTMSKYGMSMIVLGLSEELRQDRIAVNALWPATLIATAAIAQLPGGEMLKQKSRKAEIVADAAAVILSRPPEQCSGNFFIDEQVLREAGTTDFSQYAMDPSVEPIKDLFL